MRLPTFTMLAIESRPRDALVLVVRSRAFNLLKIRKLAICSGAYELLNCEPYNTREEAPWRGRFRDLRALGRDPFSRIRNRFDRIL
jgi:hypothetical protein